MLNYFHGTLQNLFIFVPLLLLYCYHIKYVNHPCFSTLLVCFIKLLYVVPTFLPIKSVIETEVKNTFLDESTMPCLKICNFGYSNVLRDAHVHIQN